jgi:hypothetical protein
MRMPYWPKLLSCSSEIDKTPMYLFRLYWLFPFKCCNYNLPSSTSPAIAISWKFLLKVELIFETISFSVGNHFSYREIKPLHYHWFTSKTGYKCIENTFTASTLCRHWFKSEISSESLALKLDICKIFNQRNTFPLSQMLSWDVRLQSNSFCLNDRPDHPSLGSYSLQKSEVWHFEVFYFLSTSLHEISENRIARLTLQTTVS